MNNNEYEVDELWWEGKDLCVKPIGKDKVIRYVNATITGQTTQESIPGVVEVTPVPLKPIEDDEETTTI